MTKTVHTIRTFPGGAVAAVKPYTVKLHADDSTLQSGNTDADGQVDYSPNLSPGPWYLTATDATPDPDSVRVISTQSSGSGGAYSLAELPLVLRAFGHGVIDGYLNEIAVTYDGAGLDLDVATGAAVALGIPAVVNTLVDGQAIATARDVTNPKACYLVLEFTGIGETAEGKVELKDVCGTAAASPSLPALTQTDALWQEPLATFRLPNTGSTTLTQLTDARAFVGVRNPVVSSAVRRTDPAIEATTTSTSGVTATSLSTNLTLLNGVVYDLRVLTFLVCKISSAGQTAQLAAFANGTGNLGAFITTNSTAFVGLANVHTLAGVVGTGGSASCGARIKVSGGTMTYQCGYVLAEAVPRS